MYLGQLQGNGLQLNITFDPRAVPGPQGLLAAVSFQEGRCAHRLQDVVVTATLHASGHGLLCHKNIGSTQTRLPAGCYLLQHWEFRLNSQTKPWSVP